METSLQACQEHTVAYWVLVSGASMKKWIQVSCIVIKLFESSVSLRYFLHTSGDEAARTARQHVGIVLTDKAESTLRLDPV